MFWVKHDHLARSADDGRTRKVRVASFVLASRSTRHHVSTYAHTMAPTRPLDDRKPCEPDQAFAPRRLARVEGR